MECKRCGSTFYVDFDPFEGIVEHNCPLCGYPYVDDRERSKKIAKYLSEEFKKLRKGKEKINA